MKCRACGKETDATVQISLTRAGTSWKMEAGGETPAICMACFRKALREGADKIRKEQQGRKRARE